MTLGDTDVNVEAVVVGSDVGLLGRDVLRHFVLTVDGPAGTFTLAD